MEKNTNSKMPIIAILFPETFNDALDALFKYLPILRLPCMSALLMKKAVLFTTFAVGRSNERDWDIKTENGEEVGMCVSFEAEPDDLADKEWFEEVRKFTNATFLDKMIREHAMKLTSHWGTLSLHRRKK